MHNESIIETLSRNHITNIFFTKNWKKTNELIRDFWHSCYFKYYNFKEFHDTCGTRYMQCLFNGRKYNFYYPNDDKIFKSNVTGELSDIVLPSIMNDYNYLCEGPYEYNEVMLNTNDVVFDLGANIGLFSSVAAAKGCTVFSFEPTKITIQYLQKYVNFYNKIQIVPFAVSDRKGVIKFHINENFEDDTNLRSNSMFYQGQSKFTTVSVNSTTIDDFVNENSIN